MPPGSLEDGSYDGDALRRWVSSVRKDWMESGHLEIAMTIVGHVLIYAPADTDGLWIHRSVAEVLNSKNAKDLRDGYKTEIYNSRGVHSINPTGKSERELAKKYRGQAEIVEINGFQRIASMLRSLADEYDREAERIVSRELFDD